MENARYLVIGLLLFAILSIAIAWCVLNQNESALKLTHQMTTISAVCGGSIGIFIMVIISLLTIDN